MCVEEQLAEGDKVVSRGTIRGTHQGEFRGMTPTGEEMEIPGMAVFRFSEEGKVVESLGWHEASSKPHCPRTYHCSTAGRSLPTTSQLGRWEETSTISSNYKTAG
jgi:SnoaL-like polyketide cyclase